MRRPPALAAACLAMVLGACSLQPVYQRPQLPVPDDFPTGGAYGSPGPSQSGAAAAADTGWRDLLADPRLQRLVEIALANNRDLRVAALNVAQVQAQYRSQSAGLFPQVDATASASVSHGSTRASGGAGTTVRSDSAGLSAAWELDFFGRLHSLRDQALEQYLASAQARKAFEILLVSQVADQYFAVQAYDALLAITQQTLDAATASYDMTVLQFRNGAGDELAVRQAQTVVEQAGADRAAQLRARAQAENGLALLLGERVPSALPAGAPLEAEVVADVPAGLPSDLLARRPDVMEAEALLRAANANIGAARAAFFPSIDLTAGLGTASAALTSLFGAGSLAWSFVPAVTLPIFQAGRLQANLDVAALEKDIQVAQYEKAVQSAFREVADGLAARTTYADQVAYLERLAQASQRALELAQLQFRAGATSYLPVLTAQQALYAAQEQLAQARMARLASAVDLYRALGGGWLQRTGEVPRAATVGTS